MPDMAAFAMNFLDDSEDLVFDEFMTQDPEDD
ncbi:Hypothetical protein F387_01367 [Wohlfahrtiimonas chitiniclastica SH04]|uniref:Uncharacterized protein n=1 Tax=Wohlfahrtiimonas chitiniclastica SH04 TaxID=1261130 RepID=L8XU77_9GAMM|nr:Hypothetical protein F387_01367 [Wohlfahrtiimonas chitiniclastica SH04]